MTLGRRSAYVFVAACLLWGAFGCAALLGFEDTTLRENEGGLPPDGDGGTTGDGGTSTDAGASALTVTPASPVLRRGGTLDLTVDVVRSAGASGDLTVTLVDLPAGVTAIPATLAAGASTGAIKLSATPIATLGSAITKATVAGADLPPLDVPLLVADPAGTVDSTFDGDGVAIDATKGLAGAFYALAIAGDGSILAGGAGNGAGANAGWLLRRFGATGALDVAFTAAAAPGLPATSELRAMAIDAAGRIVCVGSSVPTVPAQPVLTVARFTAAGALDATFAGGVVRIPAAETPLGSSAYAVAIQPSGAIVVVGSRRDAGAGETGIALRFADNGTRDLTFNGGNTITVADTRFVGVALEAGGNVVIGGTTTPNAAAAYVVTRRTAAGAVDNTFGTAGTTSFATGFRANAFARMPDGPFALAGDARTGPAAYTVGLAGPTGTPIYGKAVTPNAGAFYALATVDPARFVVAGHVAAANGEARVDRILADGGTKDPSFGDAGTSLLDPGANGSDLTLTAAAIQKDGRILVGGNRSNAGAVVLRLWP